MTPQETINAINELVENSPEVFFTKLKRIDQEIYKMVMGYVKDLDLTGDRIKASVKNLKLVGKIMNKLNGVILDNKFKSDVADFVKSFNQIADLQNEYYKSLEDKFKPNALLQAIREEAINSTIEQLTEDSVSLTKANIRTFLNRNITTGGSYQELYTGVKRVSLGDGEDTPGIFSGPAKTATITSVAQYSRHYAQTVSQGLQFKWYQYVGSTITTTRCFCHAMVKKRFFHISEIPKLLAGDFPEFEKLECEINENTGLPDGFIKGTNSSNFFTYAGGWNCQHSIFPVPASRVPADIRAKFED